MMQTDEPAPAGATGPEGMADHTTHDAIGGRLIPQAARDASLNLLRRGQDAGRAAAFFAAALLPGCGQQAGIDGPVQWWHSLEGGTIAENRPPPPGVGQPYPIVGTVPPRPALPDAATRVQQTDRLAAQREQAARAVTRAPLPAVGAAIQQALASEGIGVPAETPGSTSPKGGTSAAGAPAVGTPVSVVPAPAPGPAQSGATTVGAAAAGSSAAPTPGTPAPTGPQAGPEPATASATLSAADAPVRPPPGLAGSTAKLGVPADERATPQQLVALDAAAPAAGVPLLVAGRQAGDGVALPAVATIPPLAPAFEAYSAVPAPVLRLDGADPLPLSRRGTPVRFEPGTATLLPDQAGVLRALASHRAAASVAVVGYGDPAADTPDAQSEALLLALRRAQAMAAVLGTYGVPASAIRISAEAFGHGGAVRVLP